MRKTCVGSGGGGGEPALRDVIFINENVIATVLVPKFIAGGFAAQDVVGKVVRRRGD